MTEKIFPYSKSFTWLFAIVFFGSLFALLISREMRLNPNPPSQNSYQILTYPNPASKPAANITPVDTSQWQEYYNEKYGLAFKHDPTWKIKSVNNKNGYYVIEIDPGKRYDNFRIYISKDDYFALANVPVTKTQVGGREALNLDGAVLGVMDKATYFTFDMGASLSLKPYFQALVDTVEFR